MLQKKKIFFLIVVLILLIIVDIGGFVFYNNSNVSLSKIKKGPNLGKLNLLKTYNFKKIKEVDDEQLTSKREKI